MAHPRSFFSTPTPIVLVAFAAALLTPGRADASGFDVFGAGSRGAAMSSASVSNAEGHHAIYYNPAGMTMMTSSLGLGFMVSFDNAQIRLADRPPGYDIPDLGPNTPAIPTSFELRERSDLDGMDSLAGFFIGATTTLGFERFRVGVSAFVPVGSSPGESSFSDERERLFSNQLEFDVLGDRIQHQVVLFGIAYKVLDWMSLGLGLSFMPGAPTDSSVYVPNLTDQNNVDINVKIEIDSRFRPNAGILFHPPELPFRVGFSFRDSQAFRITGGNEVQVRGLQEVEDHPFNQRLDLTLQYSPRQIVGGGSYWLGDLLLSADLTVSLWSEFTGNHGEVPGFSNTLSPHVGAELAIAQTNHFRLGAAWEPSPVPAQTGRSNFVGNDRVVLSIGSQHDVDVLGATFTVSWHFQMHLLIENTEIKRGLAEYPACRDGVDVLCDEVPDDAIDPATGLPWPEAEGLQTGNPGFPGYSSGGWIGAAGVELTWEF